MPDTYKSPRELAEEIADDALSSQWDIPEVTRRIARNDLALLDRIDSCRRDWMDSGNSTASSWLYAIAQIRDELQKEPSDG